MRAVRSVNTSPELAVRHCAFRMGYRYRIHAKDLPGRPDLVFAGRRVALFVHGCFWHQHPGCRRATKPETRAQYWSTKLARNIERDKRVQEELAAQGWRCAVLWECQIRDVEELAVALLRTLGPARSARAEPTTQDSPSPSTSPDSPLSGVGVAASPPSAS